MEFHYSKFYFAFKQTVTFRSMTIRKNQELDKFEEEGAEEEEKETTVERTSSN